jgi:hypothetical protein
MRQMIKPVSILLTIAVAFAMTLHVGASTSDPPKDRGRLVMPFGLDPATGLRALSFEDEVSGNDAGGDDQQSGNRVQSIGKPNSNRDWLLEPGVYDQLSSAGQLAALRLNGLLRSSLKNPQSTAQQLGFAPEANLGDNIRVNDPSLDTIFHTHSETSVTSKASNILVSFNEFGFGDNGFLNLDGYGISTDGGNTFAQKQPPNPANGENEGDGVVTFGQNNDVYYATLAAVDTPDHNGKSIIGVAKSTDGGVTFSAPVDASTSFANETDVQDKEWVAVDQNPGSPNKGNVYVSWTDFTSLNGASNGSFILFARSTDGGATFEAPQAVSPQDKSQSVQGSVPVVAPNGDLYVAFSDSHSAIGGIGIRKSTDGGKTFSAEVRIVRFIGPRTMTGGGGVRTNNFPSIKVDNNGTLHVVYASWTTSALDRGDIFYVRSIDGGATFSVPTKLNDDSTTTTQFLPAMGIASDGSLGVKWWDRRDDVRNDSLTGVYMTISHDGGMTWSKNFRITDQNWVFSPIETFFASAYHGDYDGLAGDEAGNFLLCWSDERTGSSNVFFAKVPAMPAVAGPAFNISAAKLFDNVVAGNSAAFDLSTSGANGFTGSLSLSASPAIGGLTYNFANATVNAGDTASLNVSTSSATQPGNYLITVAAAGGGITRKTNFRLTVFDPTRFAGAPTNATRTKGFTSMQAGIKVEAGGTIHLVVDDDSANVNEDDVLYFQSTDGGRTFSAPVKISTNTAPAFALQSTLALDPAGNPYLVWTGVNPNPAQGGLGTFFSRSTDHGQSFSAPLIATGTSRSAQNPKIAVDNNGAIVIAYIDFATQGSPIFAVRSTDGGATFSAPSRVSQPGEVQNNPPFLALDSKGAAYVVYEDASQQIEPIKLAIASDGQNFAASKTISDSQVNAFAPQIAIDNSDNVYVTFYDRFVTPTNAVNREIVVVKSTDRGATFGAQVNVSNNTGQSTFPSLILDSHAGVSVVWEDTTADAQRDVLVARSSDGGATFGPPIDLSGNPGRSFGAFGGADGSGNLFVGWTDDSGANTDVFVSSLSKSSTGPPDFALGAGSAVMTVQRATRTQLTINVNRVGGFSGNVTVTAPDLSSLKIKQPGGTVQSTTGNSVIFALRLKAGGPTGPKYIQVTAQDDSGRTRLAILELVIQPAGP